MIINAETMVHVKEPCQNFSRAMSLVDELGQAVISKGEEPLYIMLNLREYGEIQAMRDKLFNSVADSVIADNMEALLELAK